MALSRAENETRAAKGALEEKLKPARAVEATNGVKADIPANGKAKQKGWGYAKN